MRRFRISVYVWRLAATVGAAILVAGCGKPGEVYQRPPSEVRDLLRTVDVPLYMFGNTADTQYAVDASDPAKVIWKVTADDSPLMRFTATLVPEGETQTRVLLDLTGANEGKFREVEEYLAKAKEIRALYLTTMTEAVDSTLDGRAYDITATYPALMTAVAANANTMFKPPPGGDGARPSAQKSGGSR
ncbi:MAG TPA: hypothetical protein VGR05_08105 [Sphingomicrobium sp.]|nr:hypothetical protein [Sphingomicrobium sp.]